MLGKWIWGVWAELLWKACNTDTPKEPSQGGRGGLTQPAPQNPTKCWWNHLLASAAREGTYDAAKGTSLQLRSSFNNSYLSNQEESKLQVICIRLELGEKFHLPRWSYIRLGFFSRSFASSRKQVLFRKVLLAFIINLRALDPGTTVPHSPCTS